jgi:Fe-S cluster assembly ATP-binding protein
MTELLIEGLRVSAGGREILHGVDLTVRSGEVHAVMGPNGAGKSTLSGVVMGRPGYEVLAGRVTLDGRDLLAMPPFERALAGLHLVMQYPTEVPGVGLEPALAEALTARGRSTEGLGQLLRAEAQRIGYAEQFLARPLNVDLSGGEKKRNETLQLAVLQPRIVILDELDSGLDHDALRDCSRRIEDLTHETDLGVLAITHYNQILRELRPDRVHVLVRGQIVASGGPELADVVERDGYAAFLGSEADAPSQGPKIRVRTPGHTAVNRPPPRPDESGS